MTGFNLEHVARVSRRCRSAIALALAALPVVCAVPSSATEIASWVEDVDVLMARLELTHPDMYTRYSPEDWQ